MAPGTGGISNSTATIDSVLSEEFGNSKRFLPDSSAPDTDINIEDLFTTLAEWNDYLENHVPYYQDEQTALQPYPQEPEL